MNDRQRRAILHAAAAAGTPARPYKPRHRGRHRLPCPTCDGPIRTTVGMVCQTCGTDYAYEPRHAVEDTR